jgi:hypothetical protein
MFVICSRHLIFWANENVENGMWRGGVCEGDVRNLYNILLGKTPDSDYFVHRSVNWCMTLNWIITM